MSTPTETGGTLAALFETLVKAASASPRVADHAKAGAPDLRPDRDRHGRAALAADRRGPSLGRRGQRDIRFAFEADAASWRELAEGMPINRLLRQGKVAITGDARSCVQNWLLMHHIFSATGKAR